MSLENIVLILEKYFHHGALCDDEGKITFRSNSLGFRSPEFIPIPPKKEHEIRIIITGGSVSISWNVLENKWNQGLI